MPGFTFLWNESNFVARHPGGGATKTVDLVFPDDFPGHPSLSTQLQVVVELVSADLTTSLIVGTRRVRVQVLTDQFLDVLRIPSSASQLVNVADRRYQFGVNLPVLAVSGSDAVNNEPLGPVLLGQPWTLRVDILGSQAGDFMENIVVQGRYVL